MRGRHFLAALGLVAFVGLPLPAQTSTWATGTYVYDGAGNIKSIGPTEQYRYDALGRLVTGTVATGGTQTAEYDAFGNITRLTTNGYDQILGVNPATNQVTQSVAPYNAFGTYDAAGRLISATGGNTFTYDGGDMVTKSTVEDVTKIHIYSAGDERVVSVTQATGAEEWTLRDPSGKILRRLEKSGSQWTWKQDYIYHGTSLLASEVNTPAQVQHYFPDHLGTPRLITANGGTRVGLHTYYPFGEEATSSTQDTEKLKFTGHERDAPSVDYMHARYYGPKWGRFLSVDPVLGTPASPQSWNRYSYVRNNPLRLIDPDGNAPRDAVIHVQVNVVYDESAAQTRFFGASLRQDVESGIMDARDKFGSAGIALDVKRFEGEMSGGTTPGSDIVSLTGSVTVNGEKIGWPTFVANQQSAHTLFVSRNVRFAGGVPGVTNVSGGFTVITQNGNAGTPAHELGHALGNVVGSSPGPLGVNNARADAKWGFQKAFFAIFRRFTGDFEKTVRNGAVQVAK